MNHDLNFSYCIYNFSNYLNEYGIKQKSQNNKSYTRRPSKSLAYTLLVINEAIEQSLASICLLHKQLHGACIWLAR